MQACRAEGARQPTEGCSGHGGTWTRTEQREVSKPPHAGSQGEGNETWEERVVERLSNVGAVGRGLPRKRLRVVEGLVVVGVVGEASGESARRCGPNGGMRGVRWCVRVRATASADGGGGTAD